MQYVLFLRSINVGGRNPVRMADFCKALELVGFTHVRSYINSGNFIFEDERANASHALETDKIAIAHRIHEHIERTYDFDIPFTLLSENEYRTLTQSLPAWWESAEYGRCDVLFYTDACNRTQAQETLDSFTLVGERAYVGEYAIAWGKPQERSRFLKTAYHKSLIKNPLYKQVTIRNSRTVAKVLEMLG